MVASRIISIFLMGLAGYVARKIKVLDRQATSGISAFILNITLPLMIIGSFDRSVPRSALPELGMTALWAVGIHALAILLSTLVFRKMEGKASKVLRYVTVFSNCGFMGFPVIESIFGKEGLMYASVFVLVFQVFLWTYGVFLFSGASIRGTLKKALLNPGTASVAIGILLWVAPFELPSAVTEAAGMLGSTTTPLSMIVVGASLADAPLKGIFSGWEPWIGTAMRLLVMPALVFGFLGITGQGGMPAKVSAILAAMPAAAQTVIFAEKHQADVTLASRIVFLSTVFSAITIPFLASLPL